jgi:hypothetical protein
LGRCGASGQTKNGIITFGKGGLESRAYAYTTYVHENVHFVNNHDVQWKLGTSSRIDGENLAYRTEISLARGNLPYRDMKFNYDLIRGNRYVQGQSFWTGKAIIPENKIRASHILFNIIN